MLPNPFIAEVGAVQWYNGTMVKWLPVLNISLKWHVDSLQCPLCKHENAKCCRNFYKSEFFQIQCYDKQAEYLHSGQIFMPMLWRRSFFRRDAIQSIFGHTLPWLLMLLFGFNRRCNELHDRHIWNNDLTRCFMCITLWSMEKVEKDWTKYSILWKFGKYTSYFTKLGEGSI